MPSRDKSPEDRFSFGQEVQERAKTLLEALLDYGDEALKFGKSFKKEEIEVTPLNGKSNEPGLEFNVKRNLLASWIGIKTEKLTQQESKNVSEKIKNVVVCLKKFEIISFYKPEKTGWWKLILPHADKNKLIKKLPAFMECKEAIAKLHRESEEAVDTSESKLSFEQAVLEQSQPSYPLQAKKENPLEASHTIGAISFLEYFSKSVDQLNSKDIHVRIGAISHLGTLAKYSQPAEHWTIMEYLAAFIRTNAPQQEEEEGEEERSLKIPEDIQAALTVIGWRDSKKDQPNKSLDLSNTYIRGANLRKVNLQGVNLRKANLQGAILREANLQAVNFEEANLQGAILREANLKKASFYSAKLQGADLTKANLQEVCFLGADLQGAFLGATNMQGVNLWGAMLKGASLSIANLEGASLDGADLSSANLQGANFMGANLLKVDLAESKLQGTKLRGADLTNAKNLELEQIESAYVDSTTNLPDYLKRLTH